MANFSEKSEKSKMNIVYQYIYLFQINPIRKLSIIQECEELVIIDIKLLMSQIINRRNPQLSYYYQCIHDI